MRLLLLAFGLALGFSPASAQSTPGSQPRMSPIVTWDPDPGVRPPTQRQLTPAELKAARSRAERVYDLLKAAPIFSQPAKHATLATAWPTVWDGAVREQLIVYWSAPQDVKQRPDGSLWPKTGGAHLLAWFEANKPPTPPMLEDPATRGNFTRGLVAEDPLQGMFAEPRTFGQIGGGTLYNSMLVFTKDGRSVLEPAPAGVLLEGEIERVKRLIAGMDRNAKSSLEQLEASMTPQAKAERRAKRADRWKTQFRNPTTLTGELDAADKSDESDYQRQKERFTAPAVRDPQSVSWGPRLALEALEKRLASLDAAGRQAGACGRMDPAFAVHNGVRFEPATSGGAGCVPMVRIRRGLVDLKRPAEIQLFTVWIVERPCGELWVGKPSLQSDNCDQVVPLFRQLDWAALRTVLGWQGQPAP